MGFLQREADASEDRPNKEVSQKKRCGEGIRRAHALQATGSSSGRRSAMLTHGVFQLSRSYREAISSNQRFLQLSLSRLCASVDVDRSAFDSG